MSSARLDIFPHSMDSYMQHMPMLYASSRADALHQYSSPSPVVIASLSMPITSPCTTHPT